MTSLPEPDWVNTEAIYSLLKAILDKNENSGNREKIYLVLDNARYNCSVKVKELAKELKIVLVYLLPYSLNLNPIERLCKFFKKKAMYNKYYENFNEFS
ncbi:MAG: hypothetical protein A2X86_09700 [Bdellovibrionales bacterium GWA2_49_15]|nr:MAG: hypothetical protein A2X86_09700 [Bdellovibrionales bacterium GWA2_49_15]